MDKEPRYLAVCINRRLTGQSPSCGGRGGETLAAQVEQAMRQHGICLPVRHSDCLGQCHSGPNLRLAPQGRLLSLNNRVDLPRVVAWLKEQLTE